MSEEDTKEISKDQQIKDLQAKLEAMQVEKDKPKVQKVLVREIPENVVQIIVKILAETPTGSFTWTEVNNAIAVLQQSPQKEVIVPIGGDGGEPKSIPKAKDDKKPEAKGKTVTRRELAKRQAGKGAEAEDQEAEAEEGKATEAESVEEVDDGNVTPISEAQEKTD